MTHPWMQFWTRDWLDSKELRRCSPAARGLLADLMAIAHEGEPYGHLADRVGPLTEEYLASRCVLPLKEYREASLELLKFHRLEQSDGGAIFIPRMVEDAAKREEAKRNGSKSRGNPKLSRLYNTPGFLYLIRRHTDGAVKIGIAVDVNNRLYKLRSANKGNTLELVGAFPVQDMGEEERALHERFRTKVVNGDWFSLDGSDIGSIEASFKGRAAASIGSSFEPHSDSDSVSKIKIKDTETPKTENAGERLGRRFEEIWARWPRKTHRDQAERDWFLYATVDNEAAVVACADRYLASDEVRRGAVRNLGTVYASGTIKPGWIADCARDGWQCDWPKAADCRRGLLPIPQGPPQPKPEDEIEAMRALIESPLESEEDKKIWRKKLSEMCVSQ